MTPLSSFASSPRPRNARARTDNVSDYHHPSSTTPVQLPQGTLGSVSRTAQHRQVPVRWVPGGRRLHHGARAPRAQRCRSMRVPWDRGRVPRAGANSESSSSTSCWCVQSLKLSQEPVARCRDPRLAQRMHHHRVAHHRPRTRAREPGPSDGRAIRRRGSPDHDYRCAPLLEQIAARGPYIAPIYRRCGSLTKFRPEAPQEGR